MKIRIFGPGCANCRRLEQNTRQALVGLGQPYELEKVENLQDMMAAGVMRTPALGINERLVLQGRVPAPNELMTVLADEFAREEQ
jgi:small redox-active disulfide protein 2